MHPSNPFQAGYDFEQLAAVLPDLRPHLMSTKAGTLSIDFSKPLAVKKLNQALLKSQYKLEHWDIPDGFLCPPVPGRLDYLLAMADLLAASRGGEHPKGKDIRLLDVGTGANLIFPLLAQLHFGWRAVGTESDLNAIKVARAIVAFNPRLRKNVEIRHQRFADQILTGVTSFEERFDLSVCNPPFYANEKAATNASQLKWRKLGRGPSKGRNFGGRPHELVVPGGEKSFVLQLVAESQQRRKLCEWFSTMLSNGRHETPVYQALKRAKARRIEVLPLQQGQKTSRVIAWSY